MKKRIMLGVVLAIAMIGIVIVGIKLMSKKSSELMNYVVFNDSLIIDDSFFYKNELCVHANQLEELLGYTIDGDQVYSIKGLSKDEWICLRNAGNEIIFRTSEIKPMTDLKELEVSKLEVRDYNNIELIMEFNDNSVIHELTEQMVEENLVIGNIEATDVKQITFCLRDFSGLEYNCSYVIDKEDNHFLYDYNSDCTWKLITHVFEN